MFSYLDGIAYYYNKKYALILLSIFTFFNKYTTTCIHYINFLFVISLFYKQMKSGYQLKSNKLTIETCTSNSEFKNSMLLNDLQDFSPDNIKKLKAEQSYSLCRICLERCPSIQYCHCSGSLSLHQNCLLTYLKCQIQQILKNNGMPKCEICSFAYEIEYNTSYQFSLYSIKTKIQENKSKCAIYFLLFAFGLIFYLFIAIYLTSNNIKNQTGTLLLWIIICASIIFLFFLLLWINEFLIIRKRQIMGIQKMKRQALKKGKKQSSTIIPLNLNIIQL